MRLSLTCALCLFGLLLRAETIWVGQTSSGGDTGADADNCHSAAWFNTAGNWGTDAGDISPGDVVMLTGTITTALTVLGSGTAESTTTIQFASGSKLSADTWAANTAFLDISGYDYIVIDGGTDGVIEATDNGTSRTHQNALRGIDIDGSVGSVIRNLTITNLYVKDDGTTDGSGNGIYVDVTMSSAPSVGLDINNCRIGHVENGIMWGFDAGGSNAIVRSNVFRFVSTGIIFGSKSTNATWVDADISHNTIADTANWDDDINNDFHHDGIHVWCYNTNTDSLQGVMVYGNTTSGDWGDKYTASIYLEGVCKDYAIFNNVLNGAPRNIYVKPAGPGLIANNVLYANGYALDSLTGSVIGFTNNITYHSAGMGYNGNPGDNPLVSAGNNLDTDPDYVSPASGNFRLSEGSPAINAGADLSAYFTTDITGKTRTGDWDIGAYEYGRLLRATTLRAGNVTGP